MYVLIIKLQILKHNLKPWNKSTFGNVLDNVNHAKQELLKTQDEIFNSSHIDLLVDQEKVWIGYFNQRSGKVV